jgi:hypothetical protein
VRQLTARSLVLQDKYKVSSFGFSQYFYFTKIHIFTNTTIDKKEVFVSEPRNDKANRQTNKSAEQAVLSALLILYAL